MIKAKKSLGQNFLADARVAGRIIDAVASQRNDVIIEIGPGTGALTRRLVETSGHVFAIEIDRRLIDEIRASLTAENLTIIEADALELDWREFIANASRFGKGGGRTRVVANLPYYISTPILERLLGEHASIFDMTLMLQKEVVERIVSGPGRKEYGYLSVAVQYYFIATRLFDAPPSAFRPAPKVWSSVIRLTSRESPAVSVDDESRFFALVGASFAQRRKTLANNLKAAAATLGLSEPADAIFERAQIDPRRRAETLSIEEFGVLYRALHAERSDRTL